MNLASYRLPGTDDRIIRVELGDGYWIEYRAPSDGSGLVPWQTNGLITAEEAREARRAANRENHRETRGVRERARRYACGSRKNARSGGS